MIDKCIEVVRHYCSKMQIMQKMQTQKLRQVVAVLGLYSVIRSETIIYPLIVYFVLQKFYPSLKFLSRR